MDHVTAAQWLVILATGGISMLYISRPLAKYLICWAVFHSSEYSLTKMCLPRTLTPHSFLVYGARGSVPLLAMHFLSILEHYILTSTLRHWSLLRHWGWPHVGMAVALCGVVLRGLAMYHCGTSFSHYIETQRRPHCTLVTSGIYAWCRHPSYLGFLVYVVGMQLILGTVVLHAVCLVVMFRFFLRRIRFEEWFLANRLYGAQYRRYQNDVACLIPAIY